MLSVFMNSVRYVIVLLSEHIETHRAIERLLFSDNGEFSVVWIDLKQAPVLDELPPCDAYLSDASCQYLLDQQTFVRGHCFFWLVDSAVEQVELLHLGATDCFLWEEFNGSLLRHCLRLVGRNKPNPLNEFQGDRFQTLIQNIPGAVYRCLHTETWQGMYISDAIEDIVGYPAADFFPGGDRTFASVICPEDLAFVDQIIDSHIHSCRPYTLEYRLIHRDGSVRWVEEKGQGVFDNGGNLLWIDGVIFEITEQKQFVERLERQQRNYYEKTPAMLHAINDQGEIVAVSDRWLQVMGYQREEVLGRQSTDFLTTKSQQYAKNQMLPLFRKQGYVEDVAYQFVTKDGQVIDVMLSATIDDSGSERRSLAVLTDVTARNQLTVQLNAYQNRLQSLVRRRTQALASSEARLRNLFNLLPLGIMEVDLDGCFRFVNHQFAQMVGRQELDLLGCHVTEVTYGKDLEKTEQIFAQLQRGEMQVFSVDKRYLRGNNDDPEAYFWGHLRVTAVRNGQGKTDYFIAIVEDIHERKLMEESLRRSEARLARSQAIAKIGSWEWDVRQNETYWSKESYEMFGYEPFSFTPNAQSFMNSLHPDDRIQMIANIEKALKTGEIEATSEYRIIRPDGQVRTIQDHHEVIRDESGEVIFKGGATIDVTEERAMVAALKASEARLAKSQAIAKVGNWEWDLTTNKLIWSDENFRIFDIEPQSVEPTADLVSRLTHPEDLPLLEAGIPSLQAGEKLHNLEYRIITAQGQHKIVVENAEPLRNSQGEITHFSGTLQDITASKRIMLELQASEARLAKSQAIAKVGSWEWKVLTNELIWSDELFRIYDLEPQSLQPSYEWFIQQVIPSDRPKCETTMANLNEGQRVENLEYTIISAQGNTKNLLTFADVQRNEQGEIIALAGTTQDITTIKQTMLALQSSEARLAKAQAIAKIGVWEWDQHTDQLVWSQEFYRLLDLEPDSIEPSFAVFFEMVDPGDRPRIHAAIDQLRSGETVHNFEYRLNTATSQKIIVEHVDVIQNQQGEVTHFSGTLQDVTAFRRAIIALQESETRFRELVERIDESFWINPANPTHVSYVSPAYERIWGRSCESLLTGGSSWIESIHPDHRSQITQAMASMAAGGRFNEEYRIVRPDGTIRWVHARSSQIYDDAGNLLRHVGVVTDITERKWAELNLRASEARFRGIFDQAALGIAQINLEGQFILVNQTFCDLVGYHHTELERMTWQQITHPDDLEVCTEDIARILRGEMRSAVLEKRYVHKLGHAIWIKAIASFIYDAEGQPQYLLGLVEDITEYKAAAAQLAQTQHRYQDLVDGVHGIIYQYSTKRGGIFYSSRLKEILGYEVDYLLAHSSLWYDSIHPEDQPKVDQAIANLQHQQQQFVVEYRIRDAAGNWRWFSDKSFRIEQNHNGIEGEFESELIVSGLALDITERRWMEDTLRHRLNLETVLAEISHRMLLQTELDLPDILRLLGETFQADRMSVMLCQPEQTTRVERLVAWAATAGLELDPQAFSQIDMSDYHWWLSRWQKQQPILINRRHPLPETAVLERQFLADLDIQAVIWIPIPDHQGKHWGYIECSSTDPDHRPWSREDVDLLAIAGTLIYNFWMRQRSTQQLELAKEAAEAANHAKSQFLMNMSHELRTPLNAVLGFAQIMAQSPTFPKEHRDRLEILQGSGRRLLTLLNDILDLASFDWGKASLNPVLFNLYGLLDDLKHMFQHLIQQKSLDFAIEYNDDLPRYIVADQAKLHSVLIHLLSNAIKFTSEGQVKLTIEVINHDPLTLRFSVTDTGVGIAEADQSKLFNDFVKLEAGDLLGQGSGLGLALSQKFILLMGSEIQVSSRPNIGSCFSFELQCAGENGLADERSPLPLPLARSNTALTPEHFQTLPLSWRRQFHQAACAARAKKLEQLITALPPEVEDIAQTLTNMVQKLDFNHLITLSELPTNESAP
jgi:PAS domain S-box-containing protein